MAPRHSIPPADTRTALDVLLHPQNRNRRPAWRLAALSADCFGETPEETNWAEAAGLENLRDRLNEVVVKHG